MLGEASIIKRLGENDYLPTYNGVNPRHLTLCGAVLRDDKYGVIHNAKPHDLAGNDARRGKPGKGFTPPTF